MRHVLRAGFVLCDWSKPLDELISRLGIVCDRFFHGLGDADGVTVDAAAGSSVVN